MLSDVMHPSDEDIEEYSFHRMDAPERDRLEEHLLWCESCQARLQQAEDFRSRIRPLLREVQLTQVATTPLSGPARLWRAVPLPALVAAMAAILVVGTQLSRFREPPRRYEAATLITTRGTAASGTAEIHSARTMDLLLETTGLDLPVIFRVQVVDQSGDAVASLVASGPKFTLDKGLRPGTYFIRLNKATGEPLREYVLRVKP